MPFTDTPKAGFTLLETLIAFTVFSAFIIAVHKSFLTGIRAQNAASVSNAVGQAVQTEFALIEAGAIPDLAYEKDLFGQHQLEVRVSDPSVTSVSVKIDTTNLRVAEISVRNQKDRTSIEFRKIISLEQE